MLTAIPNLSRIRVNFITKDIFGKKIPACKHTGIG
jgi:hypothetical protein